MSDDAVERPKLPRKKVPPTFSGVADVSADSGTRSIPPKALGLEEDLMRRSDVPANPDIEGRFDEPDPAVSQVANLQFEDNTRLDPSVTSEPQSGHGHDAVIAGLEDPRSRDLMVGSVGSQNSTVAFCVHLLLEASFVSASGRVERELICLLDSHACRIRIALSIIEIIKLQSDKGEIYLL